jgi:hypothetical protein
MKRQNKAPRYCMSCGALLTGRKRKYCAPDCRQRLLDTLNRRTGLLRALTTRYATFHFSSRLIALNVLPYGTETVYSFYLNRSLYRSPAEDFCTLSNTLGNAWWDEKRRTHKHYLASRFLLNEMASSKRAGERFRPVQVARPSVSGQSLVLLKLGDTDLRQPDLENVIKRAFRNQALRHHPDQGGEGVMFRRVHEAYKALIEWARYPSFIIRRGFPDKWFYTGESNKWSRPMSK